MYLQGCIFYSENGKYYHYIYNHKYLKIAEEYVLFSQALLLLCII